MKYLYAYIGLIIAVAVILLGFTMVSNSPNKVAQEKFTEWVSPDGVHYWYSKGTNGYSWLAPIYDNNGNLVIDKEN